MTTAPPRTNAKWGELAHLQIPDSGRVRVLSDATKRESTKESHLTANGRSPFGMIKGLRWSENAMQGCTTHGTVGSIAG